jgi:cephalosporin hydroxylase
MKLIIDTETAMLTIEEEGRQRRLNLYSDEAFEAISRQWVRVGWNQKYQYTFAWMGRPVIQLPEDLIRVQEVVYRIRPDVIVETGIAHGGSLIFYSAVCKAIGKGRIIGVDVEIRPQNRAAIEAHELFDRITLVEGNSTDPETVSRVKALIAPGQTVLVILDSNHSRDHVLQELESYAGLVSIGSYIVATDGIMLDLYDLPRGKKNWATDNPSSAAREFAAEHSDFVIEQPAWTFNESTLSKNITHWPGGWLKRIR